MLARAESEREAAQAEAAALRAAKWEMQELQGKVEELQGRVRTKERERSGDAQTIQGLQDALEEANAATRHWMGEADAMNAENSSLVSTFARDTEKRRVARRALGMVREVSTRLFLHAFYARLRAYPAVRRSRAALAEAAALRVREADRTKAARRTQLTSLAALLNRTCSGVAGAAFQTWRRYVLRGRLQRERCTSDAEASALAARVRALAERRGRQTPAVAGDLLHRSLQCLASRAVQKLRRHAAERAAGREASRAAQLLAAAEGKVSALEAALEETARALAAVPPPPRTPSPPPARQATPGQLALLHSASHGRLAARYLQTLSRHRLRARWLRERAAAPAPLRAAHERALRGRYLAAWRSFRDGAAEGRRAAGVLASSHEAQRALRAEAEARREAEARAVSLEGMLLARAKARPPPPRSDVVADARRRSLNRLASQKLRLWVAYAQARRAGSLARPTQRVLADLLARTNSATARRRLALWRLWAGARRRRREESLGRELLKEEISELLRRRAALEAAADSAHAAKDSASRRAATRGAEQLLRSVRHGLLGVAYRRLAAYAGGGRARREGGSVRERLCARLAGGLKARTAAAALRRGYEALRRHAAAARRRRRACAVAGCLAGTTEGLRRRACFDRWRRACGSAASGRKRRERVAALLCSLNMRSLASRAFNAWWRWVALDGLVAKQRLRARHTAFGAVARRTMAGVVRACYAVWVAWVRGRGRLRRTAALLLVGTEKTRLAHAWGNMLDLCRWRQNRREQAGRVGTLGSAAATDLARRYYAALALNRAWAAGVRGGGVASSAAAATALLPGSVRTAAARAYAALRVSALHSKLGRAMAEFEERSGAETAGMLRLKRRCEELRAECDELRSRLDDALEELAEAQKERERDGERMRRKSFKDGDGGLGTRPPSVPDMKGRRPSLHEYKEMENQLRSQVQAAESGDAQRDKLVKDLTEKVSSLMERLAQETEKLEASEAEVASMKESEKAAGGREQQIQKDYIKQLTEANESLMQQLATVTKELDRLRTGEVVLSATQPTLEGQTSPPLLNVDQVQPRASDGITQTQDTGNTSYPDMLKTFETSKEENDQMRELVQENNDLGDENDRLRDACTKAVRAAESLKEQVSSLTAAKDVGDGVNDWTQTDDNAEDAAAAAAAAADEAAEAAEAVRRLEDANAALRSDVAELRKKLLRASEDAEREADERVRLREAYQRVCGEADGLQAQVDTLEDAATDAAKRAAKKSDADCVNDWTQTDAVTESLDPEDEEALRRLEEANANLRADVFELKRQVYAGEGGLTGAEEALAALRADNAELRRKVAAATAPEDLARLQAAVADLEARNGRLSERLRDEQDRGEGAAEESEAMHRRLDDLQGELRSARDEVRAATEAGRAHRDALAAENARLREELEQRSPVVGSGGVGGSGSLAEIGTPTTPQKSPREYPEQGFPLHDVLMDELRLDEGVASPVPSDGDAALIAELSTALRGRDVTIEELRKENAELRRLLKERSEQLAQVRPLLAQMKDEQSSLQEDLAEHRRRAKEAAVVLAKSEEVASMRLSDSQELERENKVLVSRLTALEAESAELHTLALARGSERHGSTASLGIRRVQSASSVGRRASSAISSSPSRSHSRSPRSPRSIRRTTTASLRSLSSEEDSSLGQEIYIGIDIADHIRIPGEETIRYGGIRVVSARHPAAPTVRDGDVIVEVNHMPTPSLQVFRSVVSRCKVGKTMHIRVRRIGDDEEIHESDLVVNPKSKPAGSTRHCGVNIVKLKDRYGTPGEAASLLSAGLASEVDTSVRTYTPSPQRERRGSGTSAAGGGAGGRTPRTQGAEQTLSMFRGRLNVPRGQGAHAHTVDPWKRAYDGSVSPMLSSPYNRPLSRSASLGTPIASVSRPLFTTSTVGGGGGSGGGGGKRRTSLSLSPSFSPPDRPIAATQNVFC